jgi:hypothetical protein
MRVFWGSRWRKRNLEKRKRKDKTKEKKWNQWLAVWEVFHRFSWCSCSWTLQLELVIGSICSESFLVYLNWGFIFISFNSSLRMISLFNWNTLFSNMSS